MATMLLKEKFDKGLIKVGDYVGGFQPDYAECTLTPAETGWKEKQILHTEADMKWQLVCMDSQLALLADAKTEQKIFLEGEIGAKRGVKALQKYAQTCWSSKKFRATGISINNDQFKQLPRILKTDVEGFYWLGSPYIGAYAGNATFGVRYVHSSLVSDNYLFDSNGNPYYDYYGVRPAVILSDIKIDDDNNLVPFDEAEEGTSTETSSVPSGLVSLGTEEEKMLAQAQKSDAKANLEVMIVEEEKKLEEQKKQFEEYITHQKERLAKMKEWLSEL